MPSFKVLLVAFLCQPFFRPKLMSTNFDLTAQSSWSVRPMSAQQVPLVVSWIAAIDPNRNMDQLGLVDRMTHELEEASRLGLSEYYIGYFEELSTFFMIGFPLDTKAHVSALLPDGHGDYEIATLLVNPLIKEKELHFGVYLRAVQFIFSKEKSVVRILYQVEIQDKTLPSILLPLGFRKLGSVDLAGTRTWYGCLRDEFLLTKSDC
jgi:hypothetical protein